MKIKTLPPEVVFTLPQVSGGWFTAFQTTCLYLMAPEELFKVFNADKDSYKQIMEPIIVFLKEAAEKIKEDDLLVEQDIDVDAMSKDLNLQNQQPSS